MQSRLFAASLLAGMVTASGSQTTPPPCDALAAAGLKDRLLLPGDDGYEPQLETWWAKNSRYHPWCLVLPHNTAEVSLALTSLLDVGDGAGDWHIAVRSGGHNAIGASNVQNGVTIDLSMMNSSSYDKDTNIASLQPGGRWEHVFADLQEHGVVVPGGRDGSVGVGGFLLGGGSSFYSGNVGFGCDSVVNFEVVLADGSVVNANATANSDLWRALKGGGNNFGIVTRFDMEALPSKELFYDMRFISGNYTEKVVDAVIDFSNHDESDGDNALVTFWMYNTDLSPDTTIGTIYANVEGQKNRSASYNEIMKAPAYFKNTTKQTMAEAAAESKATGGVLIAGSTLLFKNDPAIIEHSLKLHEEYIDSLKDTLAADEFSTAMFFQPVPASYGQIGARRGGNMLGLEDMEHNAVMWTGNLLVKTNDADFAVAQSGLNGLTADIQKFAESVDGDMDLVYMNYADASQDPLGSYGKRSVQHIRDVAAKYDPMGAFQTRIPGGFKISRVA